MQLISWILVAGCVALVVWAGLFAARDRPVILKQLIAGGAIESGIVVQMVLAGILLAGGHPVTELVTFWAYLITALFLLPVAAVWAMAERTRWSSVVLVVAALALAVMQVRMMQLWTT